MYVVYLVTRHERWRVGEFPTAGDAYEWVMRQAPRQVTEDSVCVSSYYMEWVPDHMVLDGDAHMAGTGYHLEAPPPHRP